MLKLSEPIETGILELGERYGISPKTLVELFEAYKSEFRTAPKTFHDLLEVVE